MGIQLPLHITLRDSATFDNFYPGPNGQLLHALQQGFEPFIFVWGGSGSGKTHLLQAVCHGVTEGGGSAVYLPLSELVEMSPEVFEGMEHFDLLAVDDVQALAGRAEWEVALFHLYNRVRDAGGRMTIVGNSAPAAVGIELPDLISRLTWGPVFQMQPLNDEEKTAALQMRARRRGLELSDEVAAYLLKRHARDLHALFELLERLDRASLAAQRRLTVPFVREVLKN